MPHHFDSRQRLGGGHVWPCSLDSLNGQFRLAHVILTGCQGILKSLPNNVLKVFRVHAGNILITGGLQISAYVFF